MKKALFAGSFDPITNGHIDILETAAKIFDEVVIAVAYNADKTEFLPLETRLELINNAVKHLSNVKIDSYKGLTVSYARENKIDFLIRGIRSASDFDYEMQIEGVNKILDHNIKTIFLTPNAKNMSVSSSAVREILANDGDISAFVPGTVLNYFQKQ